VDISSISVGNPRIAFYQPDPDYRRTEGLSQSAMKELLTSPAHFQAAYGPNPEPRFASAAMIWGSALHAKVLEPEKFDNLYFDRSCKAKEPTIKDLKEMLDEAQIEYIKTAKKPELESLLWPEGKKKDARTSMDPKDFENVNRAAEALRSHDITGEWFCPGIEKYREWNEVSMYAKTEQGLIVKGRVDRLLVTDDKIMILDLKTTQDASFKGFQKSVANFNYDLQAAWYLDLTRRCFGNERPIEFLFCAIEKKAPFGISVYRASEQLVRSGQQKMSRACEIYLQCMALDYWPSYDPIINDMSLPGWAVQREETTSDF
jgi:hypothetical protein